MSRWGIRGLKTRVGQKCSIRREGPDCSVEVYMLENSEEGGVTVSWQGVSSKIESCQEL